MERSGHRPSTCFPIISHLYPCIAANVYSPQQPTQARAQQLDLTMGDEEKLPGNFPVAARAGWMQAVLTKPASPSRSMSPQWDWRGTGAGRGTRLGTSWASLEGQVGDSRLAGGSGRGAGTGEVRDELTNRAGSTAGSCFARRGQIRGWQRSAVFV